MEVIASYPEPVITSYSIHYTKLHDNIADDYRDIYNLNNTQCSEVVFAFAAEDGQGATNALTNMRNMPFLPYNYYEYADCEQFEGIGSYNFV